MISESKIKSMIEEVLSSMATTGASPEQTPAQQQPADESLTDLAAIDLKKQLLVPEPANREAYMKLKQATQARNGIWRSGPRYKTESMLRFRADHAVAQDAVFNNVSDEVVKSWGVLEVKTKCADKDEFLTRPDLGRVIDQENADILKKNCPMNPRVQVVLADGLSSTAAEVNAMDTYKSIEQGLKGHGIEMGTPFFIRNARVPVMDAVSDVLGAEVTVLLIGERPGLATGESMSCYMAYKCTQGMPESNRTVISNIHKGGTPAVEAGAYIADIVKQMLEQKCSGIDLKL